MLDYEAMEEVEMTAREFRALEDRSAFLGTDREPGRSFRCNLNMLSISGTPPRWVVGTFRPAANLEKVEQYYKRTGASAPDYLKTAVEWRRVVFKDGPAPDQTLEELQAQLARYPQHRREQ